MVSSAAYVAAIGGAAYIGRMIPSPIVSLFLFIMGIIWLCVPFALFGLKGRIERTNRHLADMKQTLEKLGSVLEDSAEYQERSADALERLRPPVRPEA